MKWKLKGIIDSNKDTLEELAKYLGIAYPTLSKKLNGHVDFTQSEINKIDKRYNLGAEKVYDIFFNEVAA